MRRILLPDGRCVTPKQFVAEALHPSRWGQVTTGFPLDTFTAPAQPDPPPGLGRAAISPIEPRTALSGETGGGIATPAGPLDHQQATHARWS